MKKIICAIAIVTLASCSSTGNLTNIANGANKVANAATTISEISKLFGTLNLTSTQTSKVTSVLTNYIQQYNTLSSLTNKNDYQSKLDSYKKTALSEISTSLGQTKYGMFLNTLKNATTANNNGLSSTTVNVLTSLLN